MNFLIKSPSTLASSTKVRISQTREMDGIQYTFREAEPADAVGIIASIEPDTAKNQAAVFYKTQRYADQGRIWFELLADDAVKFRAREISDPMALVSKQNLPDKKANLAVKKTPNIQDHISPEDLTKLMESALHRMYVNWADEPVPILQNQTPRQAMATPAGLERVKGLIRSYEASEGLQAEQQEREPVSYAFLWEALGLTR